MSLSQEDVERLVSQSNAVTLVSAACLTCILYDHLTTFDREVEQMWTLRASLAKALFFSNRYLVEAVLVFNCIAVARVHHADSLLVLTASAEWLALTFTISNSITQCILVLRVWTLYRRSKLALSITYFFYIGGVITMVGLTIYDYLWETVSIDRTFKDLPGCYATRIPSIIAGFWITPVIVESVLFALVALRRFLWWKDGYSAPRYLSIMAFDSTIYFAIIFVLLLGNLFMFKFGPPFLSSLLVTPSTTAGCLLGSHMFLHLRAPNEDSDVDSTYNELTVTESCIKSTPPRTNAPPNPYADVSPSHHIHKTEEPLPGTKGAAPTFDYTPETIEHAPKAAFQEEEPKGPDRSKPLETLGDKPTTGAAPAVPEHETVPETHAGFGDKVIGKIEQVVGKIIHKPELAEKGEQREVGGKTAAPGQAKAEHH
ncbi:hypothetical protein Hypma_001003 [Hypsizygus marmoreus]|uniref:DUF6533 domain-containing protein n=1 Tax=Hypsizygus marmoreus TaxID=39966 RepID=A0A369J818_HYPMA|nr:hypothetical protein Hypma_001003 [Hypsizygus marmoreus]